MDIKNIYDAVIFTSAAVTLRDAVMDAIKQKINLSYADLSYADLSSANLSSANLSSANLRSANLSSANLSYANLSYADLSYADLNYADLSSADLSSANLSSANLSYANLRSAINITDKLAIAQFQFIPTDGPFIGWKKCQNGVIVKLCVSKSAQRSHGTERKCRASQVKVLEVFGASEGISSYDPSVIYRKGKLVKCVAPFDTNRWDTCASGIHFYLTREEAEAH
jgi:hypothetical protein